VCICMCVCVVCVCGGKRTNGTIISAGGRASGRRGTVVILLFDDAELCLFVSLQTRMQHRRLGIDYIITA